MPMPKIDLHFTNFERPGKLELSVLRVQTDIGRKNEIVAALREIISEWATDTVEGRKAWEADGEWLSFSIVLQKHIYQPSLQKLMQKRGITFFGVEAVTADTAFDIESSTMTIDRQERLYEMARKCEVGPWL